MEYWINTYLKNYLDNVSTPDRIPCYLSGVELKCYFQGGDYILYNTKTKELFVSQKTLKKKVIIKLLQINKELLDKIYNKLLNPSVKENPDEVLKKKYGFKRKRLKKEDKILIARYEDSIKNKST